MLCFRGRRKFGVYKMLVPFEPSLLSVWCLTGLFPPSSSVSTDYGTKVPGLHQMGHLEQALDFPAAGLETQNRYSFGIYRNGDEIIFSRKTLIDIQQGIRESEALSSLYLDNDNSRSLAFKPGLTHVVGIYRKSLRGSDIPVRRAPEREGGRCTQKPPGLVLQAASSGVSDLLTPADITNNTWEELGVVPSSFHSGLGKSHFLEFYNAQPRFGSGNRPGGTAQALQEAKFAMLHSNTKRSSPTSWAAYLAYGGQR